MLKRLFSVFAKRAVYFLASLAVLFMLGALWVYGQNDSNTELSAPSTSNNAPSWVPQSQIKCFAGTCLVDGTADVTSAIIARKFVEFVGISTPTAAAKNFRVWYSSTADQLCVIDSSAVITCLQPFSVLLASTNTWTGLNTYSSTVTFNAGVVFSTVIVANGSLGTSGQVLTSSGPGKAVVWTTIAVAIGGSNGQLQYNNNGTFGGVPSFYSGSSVTISTPTLLQGTTTNDNAPVGYYGEYVSSLSTTGVLAAASGNWGNVVQITLSSGDWNVSGSIDINPNNATMTSGAPDAAALSVFSGNVTTDQNKGDNEFDQWFNGTNAGDMSVAIPDWRVQVTSATTIYLKCEARYTVNTPKCHGRVTARRSR